MLVNSKKMQGVAVRVQSGRRIGKLLSFDVDADTGKILTIRVKMSGLMPSLLDQNALIAWSQIVSMSDKEVIVLDAVVTEKVQRGASVFAASQTPEAS